MTPPELLERFRILANSAGAIETVMVAPIQHYGAVNVVAWLKDSEHSEGSVTAQDLRDFITWVDTLNNET